jgi:hypothetical protein
VSGLVGDPVADVGGAAADRLSLCAGESQGAEALVFGIVRATADTFPGLARLPQPGHPPWLHHRRANGGRRTQR